MSDPTYQPKIYREQGGDRMVVAPGGELSIEGQVSGLSHGSNFFADSVNGSSGNDGLSWAGAKATIAQALALCTANNGDKVWVAPLHNEGFGNAQLTLNVAGVEIIGVGHGNQVPRIDFDHANASIDITANGMKLRNFRLLPSVTIVSIGIDINAAVTDTILEDIEVLPGEDGAGTDEFVLGIDIKAGCTGTKIRRLKVRQHASAANVNRSEERRVGKECTSWCRSRWSPYH